MSAWGSLTHLGCILLGVGVCALFWKRLSPFKVAGIIAPCMVVGMELQRWVEGRPDDVMDSMVGGIILFLVIGWVLQAACFEVAKADRRKLALAQGQPVSEEEQKEPQFWPSGAPLWQRVMAGLLLATCLLSFFAAHTVSQLVAFGGAAALYAFSLHLLSPRQKVTGAALLSLFMAFGMQALSGEGDLYSACLTFVIMFVVMLVTMLIGEARDTRKSKTEHG